MSFLGAILCRKLVMTGFVLTPLWYAYDAWMYVIR